MKNLFRSCGIKGRYVLFMCLILLAGTVTIIHAQAPADTPVDDYTAAQNQTEIDQTSIGPMVLRTAVSLIVVVGIVFLVMYFFKRIVYRKKSGTLAVRVVGSTLLAPKKGIYLIEVEGRRLLLGVTEASISFLAELEKKSTDDSTYPTERENLPTPGRRFRDLFEALVKRRENDG